MSVSTAAAAVGRYLREIFGPAWNEAGIIAADVEHAAGTAIHFVEEEIEVNIPQNIVDALARIKAALAGTSDQNSALQQQVTALQGQNKDLTDAGNAKDATIADLNAKLAAAAQQRDDAVQQLQDIEQAVLDAAPPAAG